MEYVSHDEQGCSRYGGSLAPSESMPCSSRTETVANDLASGHPPAGLSMDYRLALEGLSGAGLGEPLSSPSLPQPRMTPRHALPADTTRSVASYASSSRTVFYESPRPATLGVGGGSGVTAEGAPLQYRLSLEHIELDTGSIALGSTASSIAQSVRTVFLDSPQQQRQEQGQEEVQAQHNADAGGIGTGGMVSYQLALDNLALDESLARSSARRTGRSALSTARTVSTTISVSTLATNVQQSARTTSEIAPGQQQQSDAAAASRQQSDHYRAALENLAREALDEGVARSARRVLQLGTVLTGQRLSDEEIRALPEVRFENAEEQSCPICLEAYQCGELLTALRCNHFFHVGCLARWLQQTRRCPLCRTDAVQQ